MKIDQLSYFLEAAKQQHIGKAAKVLAISPSAISHSIASLEEELGRELFVKRGKNILLTSHGKLLMERSQKVLRDLEVIREEIASEDVPLEGHFKIAASHTLCTRYLTPAWVEVQNQNPGLVGEIFTLRSSQVVAGVATGEYDFGLCYSPLSHPDIISQVLFTGQLLIALKKNHPVFKKKISEKLCLLNKLPAVLPKAFQGIDVCERHPIFQKFKIEPKPDLVFDNYDVAVEKVASSESWGFLPDSIIHSQKNHLQALVLEGWDAPYTVSLIRPQTRSTSKVMLMLTEILERLLASP